MILVLDNCDSFTCNLVQRIGELGRGEQAQVVRNGRMSPEAAEAELHPSHLIISPGPCTPNEGGLNCEYVRHFHGKLPILGVCLGHQCIGHAFGGMVSTTTRLSGDVDGYRLIRKGPSRDR